MAQADAAIQTGPRQIEMTAVDVPKVGAGQALLRVEGSGICGSDFEQYVGAFEGVGLGKRHPWIPGHEPVGVIEEIGVDARRSWGVDVGDRVAIEPSVPCGVCARCAEGRYPFCPRSHFYGLTPLDVDSGLWGGFADYMVLSGNTFAHPVASHLSIEDAVLFNPLGAGFEWVCDIGGTGVGDSIVIAGPGQRGLCSIVAARECGADLIVVAGTAKDASRLEIAKQLGADITVNVEEVDLVSVVKGATNGEGVDQFYDMAAFSTEPVVQGLKSVKRGGTVVLAGLKGLKEVQGFVSDRIVLKGLTVKGALAVRSAAYENALRILAEEKYPLLSLMHTHTLPVSRLDEGLRLLGGEGDTMATHVTIVPDGRGAVGQRSQ